MCGLVPIARYTVGNSLLTVLVVSRSRTCTWLDLVTQYKNDSSRHVLAQVIKSKVGFGRSESDMSNEDRDVATIRMRDELLGKKPAYA